MTGRNIKVHGHALKPADKERPYRWECYCGASGTFLSALGSPTDSRRKGHDEHKIEVLRNRGELEEV